MSNSLVDNDWPGEVPRVPCIKNLVLGRREDLDERKRLCMWGVWTLSMLVNPEDIDSPMQSMQSDVSARPDEHSSSSWKARGDQI